ncbi:hypothetical protein JNW88_02290 [Micromonospora sp. ATA32]|nr:hypothetical protein [Micromonospora sp. ATA32]
MAEFHKARGNRDGLNSWCKLCARENHRRWRAVNPERARRNGRRWRAENMPPERERSKNLRERYGITVEQWESLYVYQGGRCAGCGADECPTGNRFHVDHDHDCCPPAHGGVTRGGCGNCVRGLLCAPCNMADALAGHPYVNWSALMAEVAA